MEFDGVELLELYLIPWGLRIAGALLIFLLGMLAAKLIAGGARKLMKRSQMEESLTSFLATIFYIVLLIGVALAALDNLGVNIASLIAILGAAGLAVALALKDSLSNFAAGVMIIFHRPFKSGDFITAAGSSGTVQEIGLFNTILHTPDNQRIILPNSSIINNTIQNVTALPIRRCDLVFGISYDDDIRKAKEVIKRVLDGEERILPEPETLIAVGDLGESSVNIIVRPWVKAADLWPLRWHLLESIKLELEAAGITIPYPQRDVHLYKVRERGAE